MIERRHLFDFQGQRRFELFSFKMAMAFFKSRSQRVEINFAEIDGVIGSGDDVTGGGDGIVEQTIHGLNHFRDIHLGSIGADFVGDH